MPTAASALARVRRLCLAYPESSERISHGSPAFFVREKKCFVMFTNDHHGDGRVAIWAPLPIGQQADLVEMDPDRFFVPPYVGPSGWIGLRLDRPPSPGWLERVIREGYRMRAPKKLLVGLPPLGAPEDDDTSPRR